MYRILGAQLRRLLGHDKEPVRHVRPLNVNDMSPDSYVGEAVPVDGNQVNLEAHGNKEGLADGDGVSSASSLMRRLR